MLIPWYRVLSVEFPPHPIIYLYWMPLDAVEVEKQPYGISPELTALVRDGDLVRDDDGLVAMPFHRIDGTLRELEQSKTFAVAEGEADLEPVRRNGTRRPARQRSDPIVQSMLE